MFSILRKILLYFLILVKLDLLPNIVISFSSRKASLRFICRKTISVIFCTLQKRNYHIRPIKSVQIFHRLLNRESFRIKNCFLRNSAFLRKRSTFLDLRSFYFTTLAIIDVLVIFTRQLIRLFFITIFFSRCIRKVLSPSPEFMSTSRCAERYLTLRFPYAKKKGW